MAVAALVFRDLFQQILNGAAAGDCSVMGVHPVGNGIRIKGDGVALLYAADMDGSVGKNTMVAAVPEVYSGKPYLFHYYAAVIIRHERVFNTEVTHAGLRPG